MGWLTSKACFGYCAKTTVTLTGTWSWMLWVSVQQHSRRGACRQMLGWCGVGGTARNKTRGPGSLLCVGVGTLCITPLSALNRRQQGVGRSERVDPQSHVVFVVLCRRTTQHWQRFVGLSRTPSVGVALGSTERRHWVGGGG